MGPPGARTTLATFVDGLPVANAPAAANVADALLSMELASPGEMVVVAVAVVDALLSIELASPGEIVVVEVFSAAEAVAVPLALLPPEDEDPEPEDPEPDLMTVSMSSVIMSINAIVGPAMTVSVAWIITLFARAWSSVVMKITTGPLIPAGTVQAL